LGRGLSGRGPIALIVGGLALLAAIAFFTLRGEKAAPPPEPFTVAGDAVSLADGSRSWRYVELAQAKLSPPLASEAEAARVVVDEGRSSRVEAPLPGRVENVSVLLGDRVQEGDRLVEVRSSALVDLFKERDVQRAREAAKAKEVDRLRALFALKAVPEKDVVAAEQELREERLGREAADRKFNGIAVASGNEDVYWLTAPRAGVVVERGVVRGQAVGPDRSDPLLVIADLDEVVINADVAESRVHELKVGEPAEVWPAVGSNERIEGQVAYIGEVVDPTRRMVSVRIRAQNPDHVLRPNGYAQVSFVSSDAPRVVVDAEAVVTEDQKTFVFVRPADKSGSLVRREVVTGWQREGKVEILSGLDPGETYVSKGAILLLNALDLAQ
jgi:RND family efflux transporter MFP subunit